MRGKAGEEPVRCSDHDLAVERQGVVEAALEVAADDGPSLTLLQRIGGFERKPPPTDWDGSWAMEHK